MSAEPLGLALVDKPAGITSHDVVSRVRRSLGLKRVGHAGTLDPPATGLLLVGVGRATRLLRFVQGEDKAYVGTLSLGTTTTTLDATGEVTATFDMAAVRDVDVTAGAERLTGELDQVPPMVSAIQVGGRRLYDLAREGVEVDRAPRRVRVESFEVEPVGEGRWRFRVECSAGTYVRSLVDDLGRALGGGAHLVALRRTRVGALHVADAMELEAFCALGRDAPLRAPLAMLGALEQVHVDAQGRDDLVHGRHVAVGGRASVLGPVAVLGPDGALLGVALDDGSGSLRPDVVLATEGAASGGD